MMLFCMAGYTLGNGDWRGLSAGVAKRKLLRYIMSLNVSATRKAEIAETCGFTVKNGRIVRDF